MEGFRNDEVRKVQTGVLIGNWNIMFYCLLVR